MLRVINKTQKKVDRRKIRKFIKFVKQYIFIRGELNIVICDDEFIRELNLQFLNKNEITDVLSFPSDEPLLGEIVVNIDIAERESKKRKVSLEEELYTYILHGILHLIGFKDDYSHVLMDKIQDFLVKEFFNSF